MLSQIAANVCGIYIETILVFLNCNIWNQKELRLTNNSETDLIVNILDKRNIY